MDCQSLGHSGKRNQRKREEKVRQPLSEVLVDGKYEKIIDDLPADSRRTQRQKVVFENDLENT